MALAEIRLGMQAYIDESKRGAIMPRPEEVTEDVIRLALGDKDLQVKTSIQIEKRSPHIGNLQATSAFIMGVFLAQTLKIPFFETFGQETFGRGQFVEAVWKKGESGLENDRLAVMIHTRNTTYELVLPDKVVLDHLNDPRDYIKQASMSTYRQMHLVA